MEKVIEVENLSKSFFKKKVLDSISFSVNEGDLLGLVGLNGAGKTTLLKCLTGLLNAEGSIRILGKSLKDKADIFEDLLYIFDKDTYFPDMDGYTILKDFARMHGKFSKEEIYAVMKEAGLSGSEKTAVKRYSLGMKQRLNFAKIRLMRPKIVLMDEPFNGIDIDGMEELIDMIIEINKKDNITFLVSSHQISELERFVNRVIALDGSKIAVDKYFNETDNILIGIKLLDESRYELIKKNFKFSNMHNGIAYFEVAEGEETKFTEFLNKNKILYSYFDSNNSLRQQLFEIMDGKK